MVDKTKNEWDEFARLYYLRNEKLNNDDKLHNRFYRLSHSGWRYLSTGFTKTVRNIFYKEWLTGLKYFYKVKITPKILFYDFIAGLAEGSLAIPQGLSYPTLINVLPIMGLMTGIIQPILYLLLGSSLYVSLGVNSVESVMASISIDTLTNNNTNILVRSKALSIIIFFHGITSIILRLVGASILMDLLSEPVLNGFLAGISLTVIMKEFPFILGYTTKVSSSAGNSSIPLYSLYLTLKSLKSVKWLAIVFGISTIFFIETINFIKYIFKTNVPIPSQLFIIVITTAVSAFLNGDVPVIGECDSLGAFKPHSLIWNGLPEINNQSNWPFFVQAWVASLPLTFISFCSHFSAAKSVQKKSEINSINSISKKNNDSILSDRKQSPLITIDNVNGASINGELEDEYYDICMNETCVCNENNQGDYKIDDNVIDCINNTKNNNHDNINEIGIIKGNKHQFNGNKHLCNNRWMLESGRKGLGEGGEFSSRGIDINNSNGMRKKRDSNSGNINNIDKFSCINSNCSINNRCKVCTSDLSNKVSDTSKIKDEGENYIEIEKGELVGNINSTSKNNDNFKSDFDNSNSFNPDFSSNQIRIRDVSSNTNLTTLVNYIPDSTPGSSCNSILESKFSPSSSSPLLESINNPRVNNNNDFNSNMNQKQSSISIMDEMREDEILNKPNQTLQVTSITIAPPYDSINNIGNINSTDKNDIGSFRKRLKLYKDSSYNNLYVHRQSNYNNSQRSKADITVLDNHTSNHDSGNIDGNLLFVNPSGLFSPKVEILVLGITNIIGAFFNCIPTGGSMARTNLVYSLNVKTPLHNISYSFFVLITTLYLLNYVQYLPYSVLAAIIIQAMYRMPDIRYFIKLIKNQNVDLFFWLLSFLVTLIIGATYGIIFSLSASIIYLIKLLHNLRFEILGRLPGTLLFKNTYKFPQALELPFIKIIRFQGPISFINSESFSVQVEELINEWINNEINMASTANSTISIKSRLKILIIDACMIYDIDYTALQMLKNLQQKLLMVNIEIWFSSFSHPNSKFLVRSGFYNIVPLSRCFVDLAEAVAAAQSIVNNVEYNVD